MKTVTEWYHEQCGWREERCHCCVGGLLSNYSRGDFCGLKECSSCVGNGSYWVTPRGPTCCGPAGHSAELRSVCAPYVPGGLSCWDENCGCHRGVCVMTGYAEPWCRGRCAEPKNCITTPEPNTPARASYRVVPTSNSTTTRDGTTPI